MPASSPAPDISQRLPPCPLHLFSYTQGIYGGGFCKYMSEYREFVPEWRVVRRAHRLCTDLAAGTWHPPTKTKSN